MYGPSQDWINDFQQYEGKLLIYADTDIFEVSKADLLAAYPFEEEPVAFTAGQMATIVLPTAPEASKGKYYRLDRVEGNEIIFEQELQPRAHIPYIIVPSEDFCIELGSLDLKGLSRDTVCVDGISFIGTYQKEEIGSKEGFYIDIIDATPDCILSDNKLKVGALRAFLQVHWDDPYSHGGTKAPAEKLQKRGIESVRQRVTLLKDHTSLSLDEVKRLIRDTLCDGERVLTPDEVAAIERLEQDYLDKDFINLLQ